MKTKILILLGLFFVNGMFGQIKQYNYKSQLSGINDQWHYLSLPDEMFQNISQTLNDVRIFGITPAQDTVEAPYLIRRMKEKVTNKEVDFKIINRSKNNEGYFFTFEIKEETPINQIVLNFAQKNFDWLATLEGSQDQKEWFTIDENYRLVSIKNRMTDYTFSNITFTESKYRYFRIKINSEVEPMLNSYRVSLRKVVDGIYKTYPIQSFKKEENKKDKSTIVEVSLEKPVPVSSLQIIVNNDFDYYRTMSIKYIADSVKTEKGWKYNYRNLGYATLTSFAPLELKFGSKTLKNIWIEILNQDNQPLNIEKVIVKGYEHHLVARFTEPADYFIAFGKKNATKPNYDINRFSDKIPNDMTALKMGTIQGIDKDAILKTEPLFKNKTWLYGIMVVIIGLLGWFSLKMLKGGNES